MSTAKNVGYSLGGAGFFAGVVEPGTPGCAAFFGGTPIGGASLGFCAASQDLKAVWLTT
jgi:hypothetical protein